MARVNTYLNFPRNTEEAFNFYKSVFGGNFGGMGIARFGDIPAQEGMPPLAENDKNLIMHIELPITGGHVLMGTDAPESFGFHVNFGNNVHISVEPDTRTETKRLFDALSAGGKITMDLQDMFWGNLFFAPSSSSPGRHALRHGDGHDGSGRRDDGRCILVEEEWAAVLKDQKKCSKFSTMFRSAWDRRPISNRTKKDGLQSVAQPLLGFHAHITPGEWIKYVSSSEALGGSYNRLLPVKVERSKMLPYNNKTQVPDVSALKEAFEWAEEATGSCTSASRPANGSTRSGQ